MTRAEKAERIQKILDVRYPLPPVPLAHSDPYTLLIAPGGKVIYRKQGELDALELKRAIVKRLGRVYK